MEKEPNPNGCLTPTVSSRPNVTPVVRPRAKPLVRCLGSSSTCLTYPSNSFSVELGLGHHAEKHLKVSGKGSGQSKLSESSNIGNDQDDQSGSVLPGHDSPQYDDEFPKLPAQSRAVLSFGDFPIGLDSNCLLPVPKLQSSQKSQITKNVPGKFSPENHPHRDFKCRRGLGNAKGTKRITTTMKCTGTRKTTSTGTVPSKKSTRQSTLAKCEDGKSDLPKKLSGSGIKTSPQYINGNVFSLLKHDDLENKMTDPDDQDHEKAGHTEQMDKLCEKSPVYSFYIYSNSHRPLKVLTHQKSISITFLKQQVKLAFGIEICRQRYIVNGVFVSTGKKEVKHTDDVELMVLGLGGGKKSVCHPGDCTACTVCGKSGEQNYTHLCSKKNANVAEFAKSRFNLALDDCICPKCNTYIDREFKKVCGEPIGVSVEEANPVKKIKYSCFIPNCSEPTEYSRSYNEHYKNICKCFGIEMAAVNIDTIKLCKSHHTTYYNFSKCIQCSICLSTIGESKDKRKIPSKYYEIACKLYAIHSGHASLQIPDLTQSSICMSCYSSIHRYGQDGKSADEVELYELELSVIKHYEHDNISVHENERVNACFYRSCHTLITELKDNKAMLSTDIFEQYNLFLLETIGQNYSSHKLYKNKYKFMQDIKATFGPSLVVYTKKTVGTLLYWKSSDPLEMLLNYMAEIKSSSTLKNVAWKSKEERLQPIESKVQKNNSVILMQAIEILRLKFETLQQQFLSLSRSPLDVDFANAISAIDPELWQFFTALTCSEREAEKADKVCCSNIEESNNFLGRNLHGQKHLQRLFIISCIVHSLDNQVQYPLHLTIAGIVDKFTNSSTECLTFLNKFGICVSKKTLQRYQNKIASETKNMHLNCLSEENAGFAMVTLDNINKRQKYKAVWSGDSGRGFDGATCMVVQPKPQTMHIPDEQKTPLFRHIRLTECKTELSHIKKTCVITDALFISGCADIATDLSLNCKEQSNQGQYYKQFHDNVLQLKQTCNLFCHAWVVQHTQASPPKDKDSRYNMLVLTLPEILSCALLSNCKVFVFYENIEHEVLSCKLKVNPTFLMKTSKKLDSLYVLALDDGSFQPLVPLSRQYSTVFEADTHCLEELHVDETLISSSCSLPLTPELMACVEFDPVQSETESATCRIPSIEGKYKGEIERLEIFENCENIVGNSIESDCLLKLSDSEESSLSDLNSDIFLYMCMKNAAQTEKHDLYMSNLKSYLKDLTAGDTVQERSNVIYLDITNENPDNKQAVKNLLDKVFIDLGIGLKFRYVVVVGDGLLFHHFIKLKQECPRFYSWLIPFPGDWHTLKNYGSCLMKIYGPAGLKDLVGKFHKGKTGASVLEATDFDKTVSFLLQIFESVYRYQVNFFLNHHKPDDKIKCNIPSEDIKQYLLKCANNLQATYPIDSKIEQIRLLQQNLKGLEQDFLDFNKCMSSKYPTWKFWDQFVRIDCLAYIGFYFSFRSGNWNLRLASLKLMAPLFHCTNSSFYYRLIPIHLAEMMKYPKSVITYFQNGGFVANLKGNSWSSIGLDECHETTINKDMKAVITTVNQTSMKQKMHYLRHQANMWQNVKSQCGSHPTVSLQGGTFNKNVELNIREYIKLLSENSALATLDNVNLNHLFSKENANEVQESTLLNFRQHGTTSLISFVETCILNERHSFNRSKFQIINFGSETAKVSQKKEIQDLKQVEKILRKQIEWSKVHNVALGDLDQYMKYPLAISGPDGSLRVGPKSKTASVFQKWAQDAFISSIPEDRYPSSVVVDAMFMINSLPSISAATFGDHVQHLYKRWVSDWFSNHINVTDVSLVFDNQNNIGTTPKQFERKRRDQKISVSENFSKIDCNTSLPGNWQDFLKVRSNKKLFVEFVCEQFSDLGKQILGNGQLLCMAGWFGDTCTGKTCFIVNGSAVDCPTLNHNHEEGDTLVWLLTKHAAGHNVLIYSPDNDIYNIGLPLSLTIDKNVTIQLKSKTSYETRYLCLENLVTCIQRHDGLKNVSKDILLAELQALFICTGCDYISFFRHHGKASFYKTFFNYADFISGLTYGASGNLSNTSQDDKNEGFLAFMRLVGCEYFSICAHSFLHEIQDLRPDLLYHSVTDPNMSQLQNHSVWLSKIRQQVMFRTPSEEYYIPSDDALRMHWYRSCWVSQTWRQADRIHMKFPSLVDYGWILEDGKLQIKWDSDFNFQKQESIVKLWTKGCQCKKDNCKSKRCGCKGQGKPCGPGCICKGLCYNEPNDAKSPAKLIMGSPDNDPLDDDEGRGQSDRNSEPVVINQLDPLTDDSDSSDSEEEDTD